MPDRDSLIGAFLTQHGWQDATIRNLAGDASNRRYLRLSRGAETSVLMDAPPDRGEDVRPFVQIAGFLTGLGLSAPKILAQDEAHGFLLLEDLGDALFARVLETEPGLERRLYGAATDLLVGLHKADPPPGLLPYDPAETAELAALAFDWYARGISGECDNEARGTFCATFEPLLAHHGGPADVLIQRDYHSENLLWLPDRTGLANVGLLDFQDARVGHHAYDLVSLLQDARRDVPGPVEEAMLSRYISATGLEEHAFRTAYALWGVQRNLRIVGVFARLCLRDGKPHYLDLIPRVWTHLQTDLAHPACSEVLDCLRDALPPPTPEALARLRDQCATRQTLS